MWNIKKLEKMIPFKIVETHEKNIGLTSSTIKYSYYPNKYVYRELWFDNSGHNDGIYRIFLESTKTHKRITFYKNVFTGEWKKVNN